jgi:hypothetical protein
VLGSALAIRSRQGASCPSGPTSAGPGRVRRRHDRAGRLTHRRGFGGGHPARRDVGPWILGVLEPPCARWVDDDVEAVVDCVECPLTAGERRLEVEVRAGGLTVSEHHPDRIEIPRAVELQHRRARPRRLPAPWMGAERVDREGHRGAGAKEHSHHRPGVGHDLDVQLHPYRAVQDLPSGSDTGSYIVTPTVLPPACFISQARPPPAFTILVVLSAVGQRGESRGGDLGPCGHEGWMSGEISESGMDRGDRHPMSVIPGSVVASTSAVSRGWARKNRITRR